VATLTLPSSGSIYLDTNAIIYSVEQIAPYDALLEGVWRAVQHTELGIVSSELTLLEVLVKPLREGKQALEQRYRRLLTASREVQLYPIERPIIEQALNLRATVGLRTPDALHAATAVQSGCVLFVTNDPVFRRVSGIEIIVLNELFT
jgi:predicted nucleic acid-binding protein